MCGRPSQRLDGAAQVAERVLAVIAGIAPQTWQGSSARQFQQRLGSASRSAEAVVHGLAEAAELARTHERDLDLLRSQLPSVGEPQ